MREQVRAKEEGDVGAIDKHGVFTGRYAMNPFNQEKSPDLGGELHPDGLRYRRHHVSTGARPARF